MNACLPSSPSALSWVSRVFMSVCTRHASVTGVSRNLITNSFIIRTASGGKPAM